ncbi:Protein kinase domain [Trypanosoma vivax]|nr:Protein kinase domain [Trypanosoma vivax]
MPLYRLINRKYSEEQRRRHADPKFNDGYDDRHGHYLALKGEEIWGRYTVQGVLGRGSFGTVLKCFDEKHQEQVAAKVVRNGEYFYTQGLLEVDIISRLNNIPALDNLVVRLRKVFVWKSHLVLVFEMLSMNLFQLIQRTNYNGVSLDLTRKFAYQLVLVLQQLEEHDPPIIHSDIKPENVVLRDPSRSSIRLIDFGSACYAEKGAALHKYVQSRFYRSLEVILELNYDTAIDRWSLGCMLVELHTGVPLFPGKTEADQIARFTGVLGPPPDDMIERSRKKDLFFYDNRQTQQHASQVSQQVTGEIDGASPRGAGQRTDVVASPSPVIAAEVLHSLSANSSISAVTVTSGQQIQHSYGTGQISASPSRPVAAGSGGAGSGTVANGRQGLKNSLGAPGNGHTGGSFTVVSSVSNNNNNNNNRNCSNASVSLATRRPMTAAGTVATGKKLGVGAGAGAGGTGRVTSLTPVAVEPRLTSSSAAKPQLKSQGAIGAGNNCTGNAVISMGGSATHHPTIAGSASMNRPPTGTRTSVLTPKSKPMCGSHAPTGEQLVSHGTNPVGRAAGVPHIEQEHLRQQRKASPSRSPYSLRVPPTPDQCQSLAEIIGVYTGGPRGCRRGHAGHDVSDYSIFLDFIERLLCYDPKKRITCAEALQHPFLSSLEIQKQRKYLSASGGAL